MSKTQGAVAPTQDFSLSSTQSATDSSESRAQLDAALSSFASKAPVMGVVNGNIPGEVIDDEAEDLEQSGQAAEETEAEADDSEEVEETEEPELGAFDQEFTKRFGLKPEEAVETINSLIAFKDEMALMRTWGVSPAEYDSRISEVREFYKTLPEDKQPEFNSPEGAKAIWEHLEKTNPSRKKSSTVSKVGSGKKPATSSKPKEFIKKSDILKMPKAELQSRWQEIDAAWKQGRVLENQ